MLEQLTLAQASANKLHGADKFKIRS